MMKLNAPHDPTQIPEAPAEEAVAPSAAGDADAGESE